MPNKKMKRLESKDPDFPAWVEIPDEWLVEHVDIYDRARWEAQVQGKLMGKAASLTAVLTLALKGVIRFEVPGVDLSGDEPDLSGITGKAMGFLINTVAASLEASQRVPFGPPEPSTGGTADGETTET